MFLDAAIEQKNLTTNNLEQTLCLSKMHHICQKRPPLSLWITTNPGSSLLSAAEVWSKKTVELERARCSTSSEVDRIPKIRTANARARDRAHAPCPEADAEVAIRA
jgi:hypothetical protein